MNTNYAYPVLPPGRPRVPDLRPLWGAIAFVVLVLIYVGLLWYEESGPRMGAVAPGPAKPAATEPAAGQAPDVVNPAAEQAEPPAQWAPVAGGEPRLALVFDDWGYDWSAKEDILSLPVPITVAVLPHLPYTRRDAERAAAAGFDVLLHLPMEAVGGDSDGMKDAIHTEMSDEDIAAAVRSALATVPQAIGVNNHTGSKATADLRVMNAVLRVLGETGHFFLDSRTTKDSQAVAAAKEQGVPVLENAVFLDGKLDLAYIKERFLYAARLAQERGFAVAIGHVKPETARAVLAGLPEVEAMGVRLVRISEIVGGGRQDRDRLGRISP